MTAKPRLRSLPILVTDPAEVESIKRNDYGDLIGVIDSKGQAYADADHLRVWREQQSDNGRDSL